MGRREARLRFASRWSTTALRRDGRSAVDIHHADAAIHHYNVLSGANAAAGRKGADAKKARSTTTKDATALD
jgi:hypothetical protein